ncbi:MAG: ribose-phosphate diphosphokinase [Candidatus Omnitrophica bacterium]|nr:ribose-phosphate diphosphokinase [Candidatus Omnitrophota bacterium]
MPDNAPISMLRPVSTGLTMAYNGFLDNFGLEKLRNRRITADPEVFASGSKTRVLRKGFADFYKTVSVEFKKDVFPDGEMRITVVNPGGIKGRVAWIVQDIKTDDDFVELILQIAALRDARAQKIACLLPDSVLKSGVILDVLAPYADIYTMDCKYFKDPKGLSFPADMVFYHDNRIYLKQTGGKQFEYLLFTEKNRLKNNIIKGLNRPQNRDTGLKSASVDVTTFDSGEVRVRLPEDVSGKKCLLIHSTRAHKGIVELLAILQSLRQHGAADVHVLFLFFSYDRQEKNFPVTEYGPKAFSANAAKMLLMLISGYCDRIYTINTHFIKEPRADAYRFEGVEGLDIINLNALPYLMTYLREEKGLKDAIIIAPDQGIADFLSLIAKTYQQRLYVFKKKQENAKDVSFKAPEGLDVWGKDIIIFDDVISGGSTIVEMARLLRDRYGAKDIFAAVVHGKQSSRALETFLSCRDDNGLLLIKEIISTDTVVSAASRVSVAKLIIESLLEYQPFLASDRALNTRNPSIVLILPRKLAGAGDIVFMVNAAQRLKQAYPHIPVKVIFLEDKSCKFLNQIKLVPGFNAENRIRRFGGITYINAGDDVKEVEKRVGKNDFTIIYAVYQDEYMEESDYFDQFAGNAVMKIRIHELGRDISWLEPNKGGDYLIGFNEDSLGVPPTSINFESYVKYCNESGDIFKERGRILRKIPGSGLLDINKAVHSRWGFIYAHCIFSLKQYFNAFINARGNYQDFASSPAVVFVNYAKNNVKFRDKAVDIARQNGFRLVEYCSEESSLKIVLSGNTNVTLVLNSSVPRKLFGQLFALSNDLPSLITGQDNLGNMLCINSITPGRAFFWETMPFQATAKLDLSKAASDILQSDEYGLYKIMIDATSHNRDTGLSSSLFAEHDRYRPVLKKLALAVIEKWDFIKSLSGIINEQWPDAIKQAHLYRLRPRPGPMSGFMFSQGQMISYARRAA